MEQEPPPPNVSPTMLTSGLAPLPLPQHSAPSELRCGQCKSCRSHRASADKLPCMNPPDSDDSNPPARQRRRIELYDEAPAKDESSARVRCTCGFSFSHRSSLIRHIRQTGHSPEIKTDDDDSGDSPHQQPHHQPAFNDSVDPDQDDDGAFSCPCGAVFSRRAGLVQHQRHFSHPPRGVVAVGPEADRVLRCGQCGPCRSHRASHRKAPCQRPLRMGDIAAWTTALPANSKYAPRPQSQARPTAKRRPPPMQQQTSLARRAQPRRATSRRFKTLSDVIVEMVDKLAKKDSYELFQAAVDPEMAPDYFSVVTNPMDFGEMRRKAETYQSLDDVERDFLLIMDNCQLYNSDETLYWKQAKSLRRWGKAQIDLARRSFEQTEMDRIAQDEVDGSEDMFEQPRRSRKSHKQQQYQQPPVMDPASMMPFGGMPWGMPYGWPGMAGIPQLMPQRAQEQSSPTAQGSTGLQASIAKYQQATAALANVAQQPEMSFDSLGGLLPGSAFSYRTGITPPLITPQQVEGEGGFAPPQQQQQQQQQWADPAHAWAAMATMQRRAWGMPETLAGPTTPESEIPPAPPDPEATNLQALQMMQAQGMGQPWMWAPMMGMMGGHASPDQGLH